MKINLLLRSLADGTHAVLPLDHVLPIDTTDQIKVKILHDYPSLQNDGDFFLAFNGSYLEDGINEQTGQPLTVSDFGVEENSMVQVVRLQEILEQQEQEAAAGNPEAAQLLHSFESNIRAKSPGMEAADVQAMAAEQLLNATGTGQISSNRRTPYNTNKSAEEQAQEEKDLKSYKNKSRKNKWRIRGELLPNDGGKSKVTVHDRQYDKLECYVHALLYDYHDPATWTAIAACLQHPHSPQKTVCVPVQGSPDREQMFTASECYTISLRLDPMNAQTWVMMGACLASDLSTTVNLLDREMNRADCFCRAAELDPLYPRAWYNLALCLLDNASKMESVYVGANNETVESCLLRVLQCEPRHAGAWVSLGLLLSFAFDNPDNDVVSMGEESYDRKACLVQALKCDPKHARAWYNLGVCLPPPHFFADLAFIQDPRERELKEELRYVQVGEDSFNRQECFEKAVRFKPRAAHHWCALATELPLDQKTVPFPDCPQLHKWDCFAKALEFDPKMAQAWCGLGQAVLSAREKGMNLPMRYKSFNIELPSNSSGSSGTSTTTKTSSGFANSLLGPDTISPKMCFETALGYKFNLGRAWISLVYVLGKDYVAYQEQQQQLSSTSSSSSSPTSKSNHQQHNRFKNPPSAKIQNKEYSLKECATYNVEYNITDARAWGNLAATLLKFNEQVSITDPNNRDEGERAFAKIDILQQAIALDPSSKTPLCGKWWMELSLCMSEPGSSEDFDPRPDRILIKGNSVTKYDCIEKALALDAAISRAWFELANYWSQKIRGERVATEKAFHDFTLIDLIVRAISLDGKNAQAWMLLAGTLHQLNKADQQQNNNNNNNDDDEFRFNEDDEVTMEVDGTVHSFRSTVQKALEHDRHLPRAWRMLSKTFHSSEKSIIVGGKIYTKVQCIVKALEENDVIEGSGQFGLPATDEQEESRKERLHRQRQAGNFATEEEPFTDEELFSLWYDLASCLLDGQKSEVARKYRTEPLTSTGMIDVRDVVEKEKKKLGTERALTPTVQSGNQPRTPNSNNGGTDSLFPILPSAASNSSSSSLVLNSKVIACQIFWATNETSETFSAETAFVKALTIFNTSAKAWHGLASSISDTAFVSVANGKWNKQSCLEKTLTFDDRIKTAWVELGQILPDDARTGCAYVSMQRVSRQSCYEKALEIDLEQYEQYHDAPAPNVTPEQKLETAKLWCLFGSSLKAGVWVTLNGEALDQQRCFFKALALDINCDTAWSGLGMIALESCADATIKIPMEPSKSIEVEDDGAENDNDNCEGAEDNQHQDQQEEKEGSPAVPVALKKRPKKKKEPKFLLFTAAECFERAMDAYKERAGESFEDTTSNHDDDDANGDNNHAEEEDDGTFENTFDETVPDVTITSSD